MIRYRTAAHTASEFRCTRRG